MAIAFKENTTTSVFFEKETIKVLSPFLRVSYMPRKAGWRFVGSAHKRSLFFTSVLLTSVLPRAFKSCQDGWLTAAPSSCLVPSFTGCCR